VARRISTQRLLGGLNPEQRRAVTTTEGPLLVLAGAGTGKTRVITVRIAHLLSRGVAPENVLAVTFTNKAAGEMRERVADLVGKRAAKALTVGTFHAFCVRTLREHAERLELPARFSICDAADQLAALKGALRELRIAEATIKPRALQAAISLAKNRLVTAEQYLSGAADDREELIGRAWRRYEEQLRRTGALDFDDLLLFTLRLLREHADVRAALGERFRYVLVDEYQDTNGPQYEIVRAIAGRHENLCVVGDDDQSIYGWRGADVSKILGFERDFPRAAVVRLETNYRSTSQILSAANRLISNNGARHEKVLRSHVGDGDPVTSLELRDEMEEADYVVREIQAMAREGRTRLADVAILFRTQVQPRAFETQLRARGVPYVLVGGMSFYDRKEVRDVLAYLKLMANPDDEVSLLRVVNCPPRGVGKTTIERVLAYATEQGISAAAAFQQADRIPKLPPAAVAAVAALRANLATLAGQAGSLGLVETVRRMLDVVGYRSEVDRCYREAREREERWAAVLEVLDFAENHVRRSARPGLEGFLEEVALTASDEADTDAAGRREAVTLMTLHASKGLEFPRVYLIGMEEGLLPHARAAAEDGVEEERRLAYVGVTRARSVLTVTRAAERSRYGQRARTSPSRFLFELKGESPPPGWRAIETVAAEASPAAAGGKARRKRAKRGRTARAGAARRRR